MPFLQQFIDLIESPDVLALLLLIGILRIVGSWWATNEGRLRAYASRLGYGVFLLYAFMRAAHEGISDPLVLCGIAARGILAAGVVHGFALIVLAPFTRVLRRFTDSCHMWTSRPKNRATPLPTSRQQQVEQGADELRRQQERQAAARERERQQADARQQAAVDAARIQHVQAQREAAILDCQLLYDRHAAALRELLPRDRFEALLSQSLPVAVLEDQLTPRATRIRELIAELVTETQRGRQSFRDLLDIAKHFQARRQQIEESSFDARTKAALKAATVLQEDTAIREFLK